MAFTPLFEFDIQHGESSVRAAAHTLFIQSQRTLLWLSLGSMLLCFAVFAASSWWRRTFQLILLPCSRATLTRRLLKTMSGKSMHIRLDMTTFSTQSAPESHTIPWQKFLFTRRDSRNLLLFVTRRSALILPTANAPVGALEFAIERVDAESSNNPLSSTASGHAGLG